MARKKYYHQQIVKEISKKLDMDIIVVHLIMRKFFDGLRKVIRRNQDINIKGLFTLILKSHYKRKLLKKGKNINLRIRRGKLYNNRK